jgi:hypothetical protein
MHLSQQGPAASAADEHTATWVPAAVERATQQVESLVVSEQAAASAGPLLAHSPGTAAPGSPAPSIATPPSAGTEAVDGLQRLPIHVLSIVHSMVAATGSLGDALSLEAASEQLSTLCRSEFPFPDQLGVSASAERIANDPAYAAALWRFLAAHSHRLPYVVTLDHGISAGDLCSHEGPTRDGAVAVQCSTTATLEPVAGLIDLTHLRSDGSAETSGVDDLQQSAASRHLKLGGAADGGFRLMASLEALASLTSLTKLVVLRLPDVTSLNFLTCLGASLKSLQDEQPFSGPKGVTTLDPITCLTSLTYLDLCNFRHLQNGLAPLSALKNLRQLTLRRVARQPSKALDLQPLTQLNSLQSLHLWFCIITNLQPIAALGSSLQALVFSGNMPAFELSVAAALTELTLLELFNEATSLDFLRPLTRLQDLCVGCSDAVDGLGPVGVLTALRGLRVKAYGSMISSLVPLSSLGSLTSLGLCSFGRVSSLEPLSGLTALKLLSLETCLCISNQALELLLRALPGFLPGMLLISGCPLIARSAP